MACGTGKTYTSLKIAEAETEGKGIVLFLVPSIALLGQTLREWSAEAVTSPQCDLRMFRVEVSQRKTKNEDSGGFTVEDLALPASTDPETIARQIREYRALSKHAGLTTVFSTYQSIQAVSDALKILSHEKGQRAHFDLVICDEAHRTTGVTLADEDESAFVRVHDTSSFCQETAVYDSHPTPLQR